MATKREEINKYWEDKWNAGEHPWHQKEVNPYLIKYFPDCCKKSCKGHCKAFVPLCGKSLELKWIANQGCEVVGVELNKRAVEDFFKDHQLKFHVSNVKGVNVYKCADLPITLYNCDFYKFPNVNDGNDKFDFIWDRGGLVATDINDRKSYADLIISLMKPDTSYLIEAYVYNQSEYNEYPKNVPFDVLQQLYGDSFDYKLLEDFDSLELGRIKFEKKLTSFRTCFYLIGPKK